MMVFEDAEGLKLVSDTFVSAVVPTAGERAPVLDSTMVASTVVELTVAEVAGALMVTLVSEQDHHWILEELDLVGTSVVAKYLAYSQELPF